MNSPMIPMIAPDGSFGEVPQERLQDAISAGGKVGIWFKAPDGGTGIIPRENVPAAVKAGGTPFGSFAALQQAEALDSKQQSSGGFWNAVGNDIKGMLTPQASAFQGSPLHWSPGVNTSGAVAAAAQQQQGFAAADRARQAAGYSVPYRVTAGIATAATPLNVEGMEQSSAQGDTAGVFGHAAAGTAATVAPLAIEGITKAGGALRNAAREEITASRTSGIRATNPAAAQLPVQAVSGAEKIFRAAAPVGSDPEFRGNLYAAAGDLAEIGRTLDLDKSAGGWINPDMRVQATVKAINDHLGDMYQGERQAQIRRHATAPVAPNFGPDAAAGLDYLAKNAGTTADRALAANASQAEALPLAQVDELARAVNRELSPLRGMTPQELATAEGNSRRFAALRALDGDLSDAIANELSNRGEGGIAQYERRYAALSQIRDRLQQQMNMSQLQRRNPVTTVAGLLQKPSIAGASQAATANVNIGRMLQKGFSELAQSGIQPNRAVGVGARPVAGLLTSGAIQLPSSMEAIGPVSGTPPVGIGTTAQRQRLGLNRSARGTGTGYVPLSSLFR